MNPIFDTDVLLLQALALASKRKPASLEALVMALAVADKQLPTQTKLLDSFIRLGGHGLLCQQDGAYVLSAAALQVLEALPSRAKAPERLRQLKERLAAYEPSTPWVELELPRDELARIVAAYEASLPPPTKSEIAALKRPTPSAARRPFAGAGARPGKGPRRAGPARRGS